MTLPEAPSARTSDDGQRLRVTFVNSGILGLGAFHQFLEEYLPRQSTIAGEHVLLTDKLSRTDRIIRRLMCQRLWPEGAFGFTNLDLARFRQELHAGLLARRRLRRMPRPDVLHFHRQATAYASLDLMRRIPSIVSIDATQECVLQTAPSRTEAVSYRPNLWMDGAIFRRAAAIVSASQWAVDSLRTFYPDCTTPAYVLPSPVLLEHFDREWVEHRAARAAAGGLPRFMFMGGDFVRKGGSDLLEAWRAGGFASRATLELVTNWHIDGAVPAGVSVTRGITAHSPEWSVRWAAADVFVMPTRNEAFGLVFQEAAAAGVPAIGTRHHSIPEIISEGETGLLVSPGDIASLVAAMETLLRSAELRQRLGSRARQIIERVADPLVYLNRLTTILLNARRGHASPVVARMK